MKISHNKPPHWWIMHKVFKCDWNRTAFAFGDTIYSATPLDAHLIIHEKTHLDQQFHSEFFAWIWLFFYICSRSYRFHAELQAYRAQWEYIKRTEPRKYQAPLIAVIASNLSGKLYGNLISFDEAVDLVLKR